MAVAMATKHRRVKMWAMKHLDNGHQCTPMIHVERITLAIATSKRQQNYVDNLNKGMDCNADSPIF